MWLNGRMWDTHRASMSSEKSITNHLASFFTLSLTWFPPKPINASCARATRPTNLSQQHSLSKQQQWQLGIRHVLAANILRLLYLARTPPLEARSPGRRSNVENVPRRRPVTGQPAMATSHIRRTILRTPPSPVSHWPAARADPAEHSHYVVIWSDGCKLVSRVRVMLP